MSLLILSPYTNASAPDGEPTRAPLVTTEHSFQWVDVTGLPVGRGIPESSYVLLAAEGIHPAVVQAIRDDDRFFIWGGDIELRTPDLRRWLSKRSPQLGAQIQAGEAPERATKRLQVLLKEL